MFLPGALFHFMFLASCSSGIFCFGFSWPAGWGCSATAALIFPLHWRLPKPHPQLFVNCPQQLQLYMWKVGKPWIGHVAAKATVTCLLALLISLLWTVLLQWGTSDLISESQHNFLFSLPLPVLLCQSLTTFNLESILSCSHSTTDRLLQPEAWLQSPAMQKTCVQP